MQLQEAIDLLSSLRRDAGIFKRDRHVAALSLAIDSLEVQALVGPARASDPATSHRAAPTELRAGSQRARLLAAFHARGMGTSVQACEWADIDPFRGSPWKRVSELKAAGFIEVAGIRVSDGPDREVYSITDKGRAKLGVVTVLTHPCGALMCACETYKKEKS